MIVIVVNESLDSKEQIRAVFLWLDVNVLVFYRFSKSFYPDVVLGVAATSRNFSQGLGYSETNLTKLLRLVTKSRLIATNQNKIATRAFPESTSLPVPYMFQITIFPLCHPPTAKILMILQITVLNTLRASPEVATIIFS